MSLSISMPMFDTIELCVKYKENNLFKCMIFLKQILNTTFLLWRPPKIFTLPGGKIEQNHIFQNLTSTCKDPTAANNVYGHPQIFNFLLVQKNIYSLSPLCTRSLTSAQVKIWFFKSLDSGCRTKGPMPNLGRLTVSSCIIHAESTAINWSFQIIITIFILSKSSKLHFWFLTV
jgi:hypothetical protein